MSKLSNRMTSTVPHNLLASFFLHVGPKSVMLGILIASISVMLFFLGLYRVCAYESPLHVICHGPGAFYSGLVHCM
jgi:hypothetical protein